MNEGLINYTLHLADNSLILGQRSGEWCGHGPVLEQDIAITNISLDLIGQARNFYQYAARLMNDLQKTEGSKAPSSLERGLGGEATEDSLAFLRTEREFKNCLLAEMPNGDWPQTVLRQYFFSQYQYVLFQQLQHSSDEQLAAIAAKSIKETAYHLRWSREWVIRLGDGTTESHTRLQKAANELWAYTGELFIPAEYEKGMNIAVSSLQEDWLKNVHTVFEEATVTVPANTYMHTGGKSGIHTEHLGYILTELQYLQRAYPGCEW